VFFHDAVDYRSMTSNSLGDSERFQLEFGGEVNHPPPLFFRRPPGFARRTGVRLHTDQPRCWNMGIFVSVYLIFSGTWANLVVILGVRNASNSSAPMPAAAELASLFLLLQLR